MGSRELPLPPDEPDERLEESWLRPELPPDELPVGRGRAAHTNWSLPSESSVVVAVAVISSTSVDPSPRTKVNSVRSIVYSGGTPASAVILLPLREPGSVGAGPAAPADDPAGCQDAAQQSSALKINS